MFFFCVEVDRKLASVSTSTPISMGRHVRAEERVRAARAGHIMVQTASAHKPPQYVLPWTYGVDQNLMMPLKTSRTPGYMKRLTPGS